MIRSKDALVLVLAGGVGSRLNILVGHRAKPAVPFAGIYRIIDFSLSNVMNSGMTRVGVLTQYKPLSLMRHIGGGEAWDFTGRTRGVKILPPRTGEKESDWYRGTADAIRQNIDFIESNPSEEIIILSGDHIYQMDFDAMVEYHRFKKADITVGMMVVPLSEMHQFGAGIVDKENRIIEWEEKPENPRTNLASMGIYVFDTKYLLRTLSRSREEVDFGMHILPWALENDRVFAYPFYGYWRDVGTIQSYWEANMDIIREDSGISPQEWGIRPNLSADGRPMDRAPGRFLTGCNVRSSLISAGCVIEGTVVNSVLSPGVHVAEGAVVRNSVIFEDSHIEKGAVVDLAVCDKRVRIGRDAVIGEGGDNSRPNIRYPKHLYTGITLIGKESAVPPGMRIGRNCILLPRHNQDDYGGSTELADGETF